MGKSLDVFLTGGTGFVGNAVAAALLDAGHKVRALVRKGSERKFKSAGRCVTVSGDIGDPDALREGMRGAGAVVHLVGIIEENPRRSVTFENAHVGGTKNVAAAAMDTGVKRFVHMSALGARPGAPTEYYRTKWAAEEFLRTQNLDVTIFRPSVIIGPGGEFTALLKKLCSAPVTPVIGDGSYKLQPVAIKNVADCFVNALAAPASIGKAYCVGGTEALSFNDMLIVFSQVLGKKPRLLHLPKSPVKFMTRFLEGFPGYPITMEQLTMLEEDQQCDNAPLVKDLKIDIIPYPDACKAALGK